ncbi:hypothetical protein ACP3P8_18430 [Pseudomonas aeruginosa]
MHHPDSGFRRRLVALTRKELRQLLRDRSNLAIGVILPIVLILIFGYGLSLISATRPWRSFSRTARRLRGTWLRSWRARATSRPSRWQVSARRKT